MTGRHIASALLATLALASGLGCRAEDRRDDAALKIYNGKPLEAEDEAYKFVRMLHMGTGALGAFKTMAVCTSVAVKPNVLLTAAHCTTYDKLTEIRLVRRDRFVRPARVVVHPGFQAFVDGKQNESAAVDLALLYFDEPDLFQKTVTLHKGPVPDGTAAQIFGFGDYDGQGATAKIDAFLRSGTTQVSIRPWPGGENPRGMLYNEGASATTTADGSNASTGSGDSGGPVLIDGALRGICSGGLITEAGLNQATSADLQLADNLRFLADAGL